MSTFFAAVVLAEALSYPVAGQTETVELQLKYQRGEALFYHSDEADRDRKRSPPQHLGHLKNHGDAGAIIISAWRRVHRVPMRPDHDDAVGLPRSKLRRDDVPRCPRLDHHLHLKPYLHARGAGKI